MSAQLWSLACSATFSGPSNACLVPKDGLEMSLAPFNLRPCFSKSFKLYYAFVGYPRHATSIEGVQSGLPPMSFWGVSSTLDCTNVWGVPILPLTLRHAKFFPSIADPSNEKHVRIHVHLLLRVLTNRKPSQNCLVGWVHLLRISWNAKIEGNTASPVYNGCLYAWILPTASTK